MTDDEICDWIDDFLGAHRYAPSLRELRDACGYASSATVLRRLKQLRREGRVLWNGHEPRTLRTTPADRAARAVLPLRWRTTDSRAC